MQNSRLFSRVRRSQLAWMSRSGWQSCAETTRSSTLRQPESSAMRSPPKDDLQTQDRYNAANAAALAGCGQGEDAAKLNDNERTRLRQQALTWLRADLAQ